MTQDGSKRKLAAILSADVNGYSIFLDDDEAFTIRTLKEYSGIMSNGIEQHNGRPAINCWVSSPVLLMQSSVLLKYRNN